MVVHSFCPSRETESLRQVTEFEISLVYTTSSRTANPTYTEKPWPKTNNNKNKTKLKQQKPNNWQKKIKKFINL